MPPSTLSTSMTGLGLTFHHFGLAVRRPEESIKLLTLQGYRIGEPVLDPVQNVRLIFCEHENQPAVEIIYAGEGPGPVDGPVSRHESGIIYHTGYETKDIGHVLAQFESAGLRAICVSPSKPAPLFGGRPVSFYNLKGMGLIEILE